MAERPLGHAPEERVADAGAPVGAGHDEPGPAALGLVHEGDRRRIVGDHGRDADARMGGGDPDGNQHAGAIAVRRYVGAIP